MVEAIRQGDIPGVQLRCRQELAVPAATAWRWLTQPVLLSSWIGQARYEGGPDGFLEIVRQGGDGQLRERARTVEQRSGRLWVLVFERLDDGWEAATRLTFELTSAADGCELSVLQEGFEHLPLSRCLTIWESYRRRWREALALLAAAVVDTERST